MGRSIETIYDPRVSVADRSDGPSVRRATPSEQRHWLTQALKPGLSVGNEAVVLWLEGDLDKRRLRHALDRLVGRNAALRAKFTHRIGLLYAETTDSVVCPFEDLARLDFARLGREPFDLSSGPLFRAGLFRESARRHALVLAAHRIALEGGALLDAIPSQLAALYNDNRMGSGVRPRPITLALGELEPTADGRSTEGNLAYWRQLMTGAGSALSLPADRSYPPTPSMRGIDVAQRASDALRKGVAKLARALGVEPSDVTRAAFAAQLMRYTGDNDVVLGATIALGTCTDTMPLRARFPEPPSLRELACELGQQRRENAARAVPLAALVTDLARTHDPARAPLVQAVFDHGSACHGESFDGLSLRIERVPLATTTVDLALEVIEDESGYQLSLTGNADVHERPHLERMLSHFTTLLEHGLEAPHAPITALRMLGAQERASLESFARGPRHLAWQPELFHVELWRRGFAFERSTALCSGAHALSYAELHTRVVALARRLIAQGVGAGDFVLVPTLRDPIDTVVGMLGVLAAGGAFVPLDSGSPVSRQHMIIEDSGARFALGDRDGGAADLPAGLTVIGVDPGSAVAALAMPSELPAVAGLTPQHPAYLLYTSGSTGKPKGVVVSHENLTHQLRARLERYDDAPGRMLAPYSFAFDSALASLSWVLAVGAELHLLSPEDRHDIDRIEQTLTHAAITHLDAVPSLYGALLARAAAGAYPELRVVICGGEALPVALAHKHWATLRHVRLFNEYGPTEATVFATVHELTQGALDATTPIGNPIANCECWVLDAAGDIAPIGHGGELYIAGAGVTRGYHARPLETAKRFLRRALGSQADTTLYRTGDRCRYREDGAIEYLGRVDDQVQIRGHRVELAEVEAALCSLPIIADAAVAFVQSERGDARLVAYVVAAEQRPLKSTEIGKRLRELLPSYMVPSSYVAVDELPRNANGKTDRAALPALFASAPPMTSNAPPPSGLVGRVIAIFEELIGTSDVAASDNFFDLGGHSLLAVHALDLIDKRLGSKIAIADFARDPTPKAIARLIEGAASSGRPRARCIDLINPHGEGVTLVFVGSVTQARRVAQQLPRKRRVLGLNLFGLHEPGKIREIEISWLVDQYIAELRAAQPTGPYAIGGYCDDAKVAIAMAEKLRAEGEDVRLLVLVDALFFMETKLASDGSQLSDKQPALTKKRARLSWLAHRAERLVRYGYDDLRRVLAGRELRLRQRLGLPLPLVLEHTMLFHNYRAALDAYRPPKVDERVALYVSEEWGLKDAHVARMSGVAFRQIPGFHETMFDAASLDQLASAIERDLAHADTLAPDSAEGSPRDMLGSTKERLAMVLPLLADVLGHAGYALVG